MDDRQLLEAYVANQSEDAFATLVRRYLDLVYSTALRQVRDPHQAQDISQAVFLILARKARVIPPKAILSGWLYRTTRYVGWQAARAESRRNTRETTMADLNESTGPEPTEEWWQQISPCLDESLERLNDSDRTAILLRFFQDKSFQEISTILGIGEDAAKKRVTRALERLRQKLMRFGVHNSTSTLAAAITAYAIQPAPAAMAAAIPAAMAAAIPAAICHGTAIGTTAQLLTEGTLQMIAWTKIKTATACTAALLLTASTARVSVHHARAAQHHAALERELQQAQVQAQQIETQNLEKLALLQRENAELRNRSSEVHKLRNAVSKLQAKKSAVSHDPSTASRQALPPRAAGNRRYSARIEIREVCRRRQQSIFRKPAAG